MPPTESLLQALQVDSTQFFDPAAELLRHACEQVIVLHPGFVQVSVLVVGQVVVLVVSR